MNIVLDTNVIISSLCFPLSKPRISFDIARKNANIIISRETLDELSKKLLNKKFDVYIDLSLRLEFLNNFRNIVREIIISEQINVCRDEKDNKFLELAVNGNADFIITGDKDLLVLNPFRTIRITSPSLFIQDMSLK